MVKDIDSIEKVQRRATRLVTSLAKLTYEQRLRHLRLHSSYCGGSMTFKILNGLENVEASNFYEMRQPGRTRGHTMKIFKPRARLLTRQKFFSIRVICGTDSRKMRWMPRQSLSSKPHQISTGIAWDMGTNKSRWPRITH